MNNNGVITAPVTTTDVSTVLQTSSHDVGTLCSMDSINMWAKYKPVDYNSVAPDRDGEWWKGTDGMCGINVPSQSGGLDQIYDQPWTYNPPNGGATAPYRLADFDGYNDKCTYFVTGKLVNEEVSLDYENNIYYTGVWVSQPTATNNLQAADCDLIASFRYAVKLDVNLPTGARSYIITSSQTISDSRTLDTGLLQVAIDFSQFQGLDSTKFKLTQFFTTSSYTELTTFPSAITCYSIPNYLTNREYTNQIQISYSQVSGGLVMYADGLANNDINGTYRDEDYYMTDPYVVGDIYNYQYWKLSVQNLTNQTITLRVNDLTWNGPNLANETVQDSYSNGELRLYNSNKSQVSSLNIGASEKITIYVRTRLFNKGISTIGTYGTVYGTWNGYYTNASLNITNKLVGRFESAIRWKQ